MADQNKVEIQFEAKLDEITAALGQLSSDFKKFSNDVKSSMKGAESAINDLLGKVKTLVEAWLSFEGVKKAVEITKDMGVEAYKLGAIFGISATEASQFAVAIEDVHGTVDQVQHAAAFLSRQMRENSDVLARYGLQTRDGNGQLKDQKTLFMDAVAAINQYKAGTDRNIASIAMFGRGALELQEVLKLTPERLEEARIKADALGLTLTQHGLAVVLEYRDAVQDATDVLKGLAKVVGEAVMPIITAMGEWFGEVGPAAIQGFKVAVNVVATAVWGIVFAIQAVSRVVVEVVRTVVTSFIGIGTAIWKALHGDFAGAAAAAQAADQKISDDWQSMWDRMKKDAEKARDGMANLWDPDHSPVAPPTGGKGAPTHDKTLMAQLEANFAQYRAAFEAITGEQGRFEKVSLESERAYWQQYTNDTRLNLEEQLKIQLRVAQLSAAIANRDFATKLRANEAEQAQYKNNLDEKLRLQQQHQAMVEKAFPKGGPEVEAEKKKTAEILREIRERNVQILEETKKHNAEMQAREIDEAAKGLATDVQLRKISKLQELAAEEQLENQRIQIQRDSLQEQIDIESARPDRDPTKIAAMYRQMEDLEQSHQHRITDIKRQASVEQNKFVIQGQQAVEQEFANLLTNLMKGTKSLKDALLDFSNAILAALQRIAAQKIAESLLGGGTAGGGGVAAILGGLFGSSAPAATTPSVDAVLSQGMVQGVPSYDTGTPYVPNDMLALIHKGERVVPASENNGAYGMTVHNYFTISGPISRQTQTQIAASAAAGLSRARDRNG